jgi:hypothetical protein
MTTDIKNQIYTELAESIEDTDKVIQIYGLVEDLEISNLQIFTGHINNLKTQISDLDNKMTIFRTQIEDERTAIKSLLTIRQSLGNTMHKIYNKNSSFLNGLGLNYKELASKTPSLKKKDLINNDGVKLSLAVIHKKCDFTSIKLALYYIQLNNTVHPPTTPIKTIINSINNVRCAKSKYPDFKPFDLSLDIGLLDEIERLI